MISEQNLMYEIYPIPQSIKYKNEQINFNKNINIVKNCIVNKYTLNSMEEYLKENNIIYKISDSLEDESLNIILSLKDMNKKEGYILDINENISIDANDLSGLFYGLITLIKILKQSDKFIEKCIIEDYPNIMYRGYIEGFYGYPWSHNDRISLMKFGGEHKFNTYIYAPKDDPYHRKNWRDLYPEDKADEIKQLAEQGHINNVNFVWTIHPGDTIDLLSEEDFKSTIKKLEQLYSLGVRQFGVLFDDIGGIPDGKKQADYINRVDTEFVKPKKDVQPLITVGTRYCEAWGPSMEGYFKDFVETLHKDVEIMWTGAATMSNISYEQLDAPKRKINNSSKDLAVWWNYPVNDYCDSKVLMGKLENLKPDLTNATGFFSNPMVQAEASKQALFCIADHNWNTKAFDCDKSYSASFRAIAPEVSKELEVFASNICYLKEDGGDSGVFLFDESWYLKDDIKNLQNAIDKDENIDKYLDVVLKHFININTSTKIVKEKCLNKKLIKELSPFLDALILLTEAGEKSLLALKNLKNNDIDSVEKNNYVAIENIQKMQQCEVDVLKEGNPRMFVVDVGTLVLKPFVQNLINTVNIKAGIESKPMELNYDMKNIALKSLGVTATSSTGKDNEEQVENLIKGKIAGGKWCSLEYRPAVIIDLKEIKNLKQYRIINCGHPDAGENPMWNTKRAQILASIDGENFNIVDEFENKEHIVNRMFFDEVEARYIKLQILEPAQISINGGGHTRIYAFELFEDAYPYQSDKILPSDIKLNGSVLQIKNIKKGDIIKIYENLDDKQPLKETKEAQENLESIIIEDFSINKNRIFLERVSKNYLPSIRTSKAL
ncbi:beta-N-acetylglucosaminidase domain-containing protein [uncultured Tyzzerella sp.]|uniref:beta-N-acetylglucosaminidase domain-containing protein n=1 Tax=uncultured Tyzzerella sp. TaxID=2321398 RepID=UPI002943927D|nr:beta-N-acetylglucosaminidase domain-containing protein [uncultured Tyzzerella sp.]